MDYGNMFARIAESVSNRVVKPENEYVGEDGLLHCSTCHSPTQCVVDILGTTKTVRCICKCRVAELEADKRRMQAEENERQRRRCFSESAMHEWTFANDDRQNPKISDAMQRYAEKFEQFKADSKGLLLYGTVGTGKSYYAAAIANALIDKGYICRMTNFATLINELQGKFDGKQDYINALNRCDLLIIDDLGIESKSEFRQEVVFNIIDSRYRSGKPFIITTNLTPDEIKGAKDVGQQRVFDRVLERCFPLEIAGTSRRRQALKDTHGDVKELLGL